MKRTGHGKSTVLLLVLLLLVTGALLVGGTFAENVALTGTETQLADGKHFDVELQYYSAAQQDYVNMIESEKDAVTQGMFWCPGRTEVIYLRVVNNEKFPVQATVSLNVEGAENFGGTLDYAVMDGQTRVEKLSGSWATLLADQSSVLNGDVPTLLTINPLSASGAPHDLALAIHMDESASSAYQNAQMELSFSLRVDSNYEPGQTPAPDQTTNQ